MRPEPFVIAITDAVLDDLRQRLRSMRWPRDLGNDQWSYGFNADYLRSLVDTWLNDYEWRDVERRINTFQHYRVTIDDVPIHFIREPGCGPKPIPLIISHGWPSTFWDMQKVIRPLADPAAFGGDPADAFDVFVPSLPGFGFSTPVPRAGINSCRTADLWQKLMTEVLGFERYAASGGDWGSRVTAELGHKYSSSLYGIHVLGATPLDLFNGERWWDITSHLVPYETPPAIRKPALKGLTHIVSHVAVQTVEPQTLAYAMHDSPVGQLAWITQRWRDWGDTHGNVESMFPREFLLTTSMIYWLTESFVSSVRYYGDAVRYPWRPSHDRQPVIEAPTGITFLGGENPPGVTTERRVEAFLATPAAKNYNLHFVNAHERGGHFGHYENPEACIHDIRSTFRTLR
jgi:pimeloyl-ACP methyl ester carboxylesterase